MSNLAEQGDHRESPRVALTEGQRRAIGSLLSQVAQAVARYETLGGAPLEERLGYTQVRNELQGIEITQLYAVMTALVHEANALATLCTIPAQWPDVRAALAGQFNILWSDAEDTGPSRLTGYGSLHPATATTLGPHITALARLSFLVTSIAQGHIAPTDVWRILDTLDRPSGEATEDPRAPQ